MGQNCEIELDGLDDRVYRQQRPRQRAGRWRQCAAYVSYNSGATGTIEFGANGGTLTSRSLYVSPGQLQGTGTVNTRGLVSDIDLTFDGTHGASPAMTLNGGGQNVTVNLDLTGVSGVAVGG